MRDKFSNKEIIEGINNNTKAIFDYIEKKIKPKAKNIILNKGGNREDVKEVFQISMIKVFDKIREKTHIDNFEHYLLQTCKNVWLDKTKAAQDEKKKNEEYFRIHEFGENEVDEHERFLKVMEILNKLNKGCREIFQMKANNMSIKEIAEELGYTERYVINKKARCKKKYLKFLNKRN
ncbi:MAG: sigma-70 family RNA polymerase sigma factor [Bacteroidales bacterium]|nr:sigma-70 family RNA polymerase sigma factor [Bacteroidales bacterium]